MNDNNEINRSQIEEDNKRNANLIRNSIYKKRESIISQKNKEFPKRMKSGSILLIKKEKKKININISQNININTNNVNKSEKSKNESIINNENKSKYNETKKKGMKMKTSIFFGKNKKYSEGKIFLPGKISINGSHSKEYDSSKKIDKLSLRNTKIETKETKDEQYFEFYINYSLLN